MFYSANYLQPPLLGRKYVAFERAFYKNATFYTIGKPFFYFENKLKLVFILNKNFKT